MGRSLFRFVTIHAFVRQIYGRTNGRIAHLKTVAAYRASVKLFELGVRTPGGLFLGVRYAGVSLFGVFLGLRLAFRFSA